MSTSRTSDQLIDAFFQEGLDELPDRSFDAVRTAVDQTRQWAVVGPWKEPQIMTAARFALIAAAIAVVAVVAIRFLPSSTVGPAPGPSATPTAPPAPSPSPIALTVNTNGPAPIDAGTYSVGVPFLIPLTVTVPASWEGNIGGPYAAYLAKSFGTENVSFTTNQSIYADACHYSAGLMSPPPGNSANALAQAFSQIRGTTTSAISDISIDGYAGKQVTLTSPSSTTGCDLAPDSGGNFRIWRLPLGGTEDVGLSWEERLQILDVGGQLLVIQSSGPTGQNASQTSEVQQILDSVTIHH